MCAVVKPTNGLHYNIGNGILWIDNQNGCNCGCVSNEKDGSQISLHFCRTAFE